MSKFTLFTVLMTVVTVVAVSDVLVNDYLDEETAQELKLPEEDANDISNTIAANVLGSIPSEEIPPEDEPVGELEVISLDEEETETGFEVLDSPIVEDTPDFEQPSFTEPKDLNVYIREDHLRPAGYLDSRLATEVFSGQVFKNISLDDLADLDVEQALIRTDNEYLTRVYVIEAGFNSDIQSVYELMKVRGNEDSNASVNETNEFGSASFYMNDVTRSSTAFLTTRIGRMIYSFSYPKQYHPQVKNLITLLEWEFGVNSEI